MSFTNKDFLKGYAQNDAFFLQDGFDLTNLLTNTDNLIYQATGITAPSDAADGVPMLREIANDLMIYRIPAMQTKVSEEEMKRRKTLFQEAMDKLEKIRSGVLKVIDADGNIVSKTQAITPIVISQRRIISPL